MGARAPALPSETSLGRQPCLSHDGSDDRQELGLPRSPSLHTTVLHIRPVVKQAVRGLVHPFIHLFIHQ